MEADIIGNLIKENLLVLRRFHFKPSGTGDLNPSERYTLFSLYHLLEESGHRVKTTDLSSQMGVKPPTLSPKINVLEEKGYIRRHRSKNDGRVFFIEPTEKAQQIFTEIEDGFLTTCIELGKYLGEKDSLEFIRLLSVTHSFFKQYQPHKGDRINAKSI